MKSAAVSSGLLRRNMVGLLGGLTAAIALRSMIRTIAGFEQAMATVRGVTKATGEEFEALNAKARALGATTVHTGQQAAEGLLFLARAGFDTQESLAAIGATLNLATAGAIDLGRAADIASNSVKQFNLSAAETSRVVDVMIATTNASNTNVEQLAEALKLAGPVAGAFGQTVENTAASLGVLGDAGIQASLAGTGLRGIIAGLSSPTTKAAEAIESLGVELHEVDFVGESVTQVFDRFKRAGLGATDAVRIFSRRQVAAALVMTNSVEKLRELTKANEQARGEAKRMADIMQDTLAGSFKALTSAVQELFIATGDEGLTGSLRSMLDTMTEATRIIAGMEGAVFDASESGKRLALVVKALTKAALAYIGVKIVARLWLTTKAMWGLRTATLATNAAMRLNPYVAVATAVSGLVAAYILLADKSDKAAEAAERQSKTNKSLKAQIDAAAKARRDFTEAQAGTDAVAKLKTAQANIVALTNLMSKFREEAGKGQSIKVTDLVATGVDEGFFTQFRPSLIESQAKRIRDKFATTFGNVDPEFGVKFVQNMFKEVGIPANILATFRKSLEDASVLTRPSGAGGKALAGGADPFVPDLGGRARAATEAVNVLSNSLKQNAVINEAMEGSVQRVVLQLERITEAAKKAGLTVPEFTQAALDATREFNKLTDAVAEETRWIGIDARSKRRLILVNKILAAGQIALTVATDEQKEAIIAQGREAIKLLAINHNRELAAAAVTKAEREAAKASLAAMRAAGHDGAAAPTTFGGGFNQFVGEAETALLSVQNIGANAAASIFDSFQVQLFDPMTGEFTRMEDFGKQVFANLANAAFQFAQQLAVLGLLKLLGSAFSGSFPSSAFGGGIGLGGQGVPGFMRSSPIGLGNNPFAKGGVFNQGREVVPFAGGGVVSGPTTFPIRGGKTGLMGESGTEAIVPLHMGSRGLGIDATGLGSNTNVVNITFAPVIHAKDSTGVKSEMQKLIPQMEAVAERTVSKMTREQGFRRTIQDISKGSS